MKAGPPVLLWRCFNRQRNIDHVIVSQHVMDPTSGLTEITSVCGRSGYVTMHYPLIETGRRCRMCEARMDLDGSAD